MASLSHFPDGGCISRLCVCLSGRRIRKENRQRGKGKRGMPAESESSVKLSPKLLPVTAAYIPLARLHTQLRKPERSLLARKGEEWALGRRSAAPAAVRSVSHRIFVKDEAFHLRSCLPRKLGLSK